MPRYPCLILQKERGFIEWFEISQKVTIEPGLQSLLLSSNSFLKPRLSHFKKLPDDAMETSLPQCVRFSVARAHDRLHPVFREAVTFKQMTGDQDVGADAQSEPMSKRLTAALRGSAS